MPCEKTAKRSELPVSYPIKITPGDDFLGPVFRHKNPDGSPIDTSGWTVTGGLYASSDCGEPEVIPLVIVMYPAPDFGYQPTLPNADTVGLNCVETWYNLPTEDTAGIKTTYYAGCAEIGEA